MNNTLTDVDRGMLDLERQWWAYPGAKEAAIREQFDMTTTRFYQRVNELIDTEAALAHDPLLIKRLRRIRAQRGRTRAAAALRTEI